MRATRARAASAATAEAQSSGEAYSLTIRYRGKDLGFTAISTDVAIDLGMYAMLTNNLAVHLCSVFEKQPPQMVAIAASASKRSLRRKNSTPRSVDCPVITNRRYDIVRGY